MNYQRFIEQLPGLYTNWGQASVHPQSEAFDAVLEQVKGTTTANVMQLLNFAVECMESNEVYCEIGCDRGANLIGALLNHPLQMAYVVDNFTQADNEAEKIDQFSKNIFNFGLEEQVFFSNQDIEEFFLELREIQPTEKISVYFYSGAKDYRTQLLGLLLVKPFLADKALIVVHGSNYSTVQQASWDFMAAHRECQLMLDLPTTTNTYHTFGNGIQVYRWDINQDSNYTWSNFRDNFRNQPFLKTLADFEFEFELNKKKVIEELLKQALSLEILQQFVEAEAKYKEIINWDNHHTIAYHNLGMVYYAMARYNDAIAMLGKSLSLNPDIGLHHYSLGLVLEKLGNISQAIAAYQKAIALNPQFPDAYNNFGNILSKSGLLDQAESLYRQAIAANPHHFGSYLNLGNGLIVKSQIDAAIEVYQKALQIKPHDLDILYNLGVAFDRKNEQAKAAFYFGDYAYRQGNYADAIIQYEKFLVDRIGDIDIYLALAECYKAFNQQESVIKAYQEGLRHYPTSTELYLRLILVLQRFGRLQEAITVAKNAIELLPNDLALKLEKQRLEPIIYEVTEEVDFYRNKFAQQLTSLIQETSLGTDLDKKNALKGIGYRTNLHLPCQGKNDLELQKQYGQFVHEIMVANYPEYDQPLAMPPVGADEKIRIGYVSTNMINNNGAKWLLGWIKNFNKQDFAIYCYYIGVPKDLITKQFHIYSDAFYHLPGNIEVVCQQIADDKLHIIVYPDVCQHPDSTKLAALRLAPVQCTAWGHPVTSGIPTLDYYLSSELMEPPNAQEHYSEKLILLPNIGLCYPKPALPTNSKERFYFQLRDDAVVYLSCQSLWKYLPQHDYIFAAIAQRIPESQFAFIKSDISQFMNDKFWKRLQKAFASFGLNSEEYCVMLPPLPHTDYLNLNLVSDIFLDTFSWSGGNTTLEAIACNLPVVTCPGEFMRGRHSYGILKMLGVTETIAKDEAEYIEIAVRLGLDKQWRQSMIQQIMQNHDRLYEDKTCVEALEAFYQRVVQEG
jgi:protein O-GlcNAc transferase